MSPNQRSMYFAEWRKCWRVIVLASGGQTVADEDTVRAGLTVKALGYAKSSRLFDNREFDRVLAAMWAISESSNIDLQLRQINQPFTRADGSEWAKYYLDAIGIEQRGRNAYLDAIARRICKCALEDVSDENWPDILAALNHTRMHKAGVAHNHPHSGHYKRTQYSHRVGSHPRKHEGRDGSVMAQPEAIPAKVEAGEGDPF